MLSFLGLQFNYKKDFRALLSSVFLSFLCILFIIFVKSLIVGDSFEDIYELAINGLSLFSTVTYGLFCFFQEILFRGVLQRFLMRKFCNAFVSVVITTVLFLLFHYNYDTITIIGALFISVIAGIATIRDDNIYKAFFFHWIIGGLGYVFITLSFIG